MFNKDKDYRFDWKAFQEDCVKCNLPLTDSVFKGLDGAKVQVSRDRTQGLICIARNQPMNFNGRVVKMQGEPEAYLVERDWCREA